MGPKKTVLGRGASSRRKSAGSVQTMHDVAKLAGVAVSTVSAVINGTANVSVERTKRVHDAMRSLRYHPDQIARSLKVGRSNIIGVVVPDITNPFYPEVIRGIEGEARRHGYEVLLCDSNEDAGREREYLSALFSRRVDGAILACSNSSAAYGQLVYRRFPLVFVDRIPKRVRQNAVSTDNVNAACLGTRHLIELGHKRIAVLAGDLDLSTHAARLEGFKKAMQGAGLAINEEYLRCGNLQIEDGYEAGMKLLTLKRPPTAVLASNNKLLLGLLRALKELRVSCPEQVSVVGFDDHVWNQHFNPKLTCLAQPSYEIGKRAFDLLLARMEHRPLPRPKTVILLDADLKIRESSGPPPKAVA